MVERGKRVKAERIWVAEGRGYGEWNEDMLKEKGGMTKENSRSVWCD
jgi:hypothetical protein